MGQSTSPQLPRFTWNRLFPGICSTARPRDYTETGTEPAIASISDAVIIVDHNAVVLFTIDRLARSPRTTARSRSTGTAPDT